MDLNNINGNEVTFTEFNFEYPASTESVQFERTANFTMVSENFTHKNVNKPTSTTSIRPQNPDDNLIISPPFPPNIEPKVLALELFNKGGKRSKKMLNEFFLFRKEFVRELKRQNLHPRQTKVSSLASTSWHKQKPSVKDEYRRLAREVEHIFNIERQREAKEASKAESNESSTDDSVPSPTDPNNLHLPQLSLSNSDNMNTFLNNQNNVRLPSTYQEYFSWPYNHNQYDRQYIRNVTPVTSSSYSRHFTTTNYLPYVDQVVVPSQNSQDYFTPPNYSR